MLTALLEAGADATIADDNGDLPLAAAVRANSPRCVTAVLNSCVAEPSKLLLFANAAGDNSVFLAEQLNVALCKRVLSSAVAAGDHDALASSNAVVTTLLKSLGSSGTPLTSVRHVHDCFARGVVFSDKGK